MKSPTLFQFEGVFTLSLVMCVQKLKVHSEPLLDSQILGSLLELHKYLNQGYLHILS
jgi:hypothetical protein